jgi:Carbon-nitrogen hydrolase
MVELIAGPDVMGDRPASHHHHADDHLHVVRLTISAVAVVGQTGRSCALEVGARDVVKHQVWLEAEQVAEPVIESHLDLLLGSHELIQRSVPGFQLLKVDADPLVLVPMAHCLSAEGPPHLGSLGNGDRRPARRGEQRQSWEKQGREFPVFQHGDVKFGVVICSDGGYIEPARIFAAKGAKIIFAPHNNYVDKEYLLEHYRTVRSDHTARAVENSVYFVRGNNYVPKDPKADRVGYGDSYIVDPYGEIVARARQFEEDFVFADLNLALARNNQMKIGRSLWSQREFGKILADVALSTCE